MVLVCSFVQEHMWPGFGCRFWVGGLMLNFGRHFKKDNTEGLPFGNFTKSYDHLNPMLGLSSRDTAKEGPLIPFKFCLHHNTRGPWNLGGGRYEEKEDRGRNRKVEGRGERKERRWGRCTQTAGRGPTGFLSRCWT